MSFKQYSTIKGGDTSTTAAGQDFYVCEKRERERHTHGVAQMLPTFNTFFSSSSSSCDSCLHMDIKNKSKSHIFLSSQDWIAPHKLHFNLLLVHISHTLPMKKRKESDRLLTMKQQKVHTVHCKTAINLAKHVCILFHVTSFKIITITVDV